MTVEEIRTSVAKVDSLIAHEMAEAIFNMSRLDLILSLL